MEAVICRKRVSGLAGALVASLGVGAQLAADARIVLAFIAVNACEIVGHQFESEWTAAKSTSDHINAVVGTVKSLFGAFVNVYTPLAADEASSVACIACAVFLRRLSCSICVAVGRAFVALAEGVVLECVPRAVLAVSLSIADRNPSWPTNTMETSSGIHAYIRAGFSSGTLVYVSAVLAVVQ